METHPGTGRRQLGVPSSSRLSPSWLAGPWPPPELGPGPPGLRPVPGLGRTAYVQGWVCFPPHSLQFHVGPGGGTVEGGVSPGWPVHSGGKRAGTPRVS